MFSKESMIFTFSVDTFPPSPACHLPVDKGIQHSPVEHYTSDDHPPSRKVHPRGESGSGHENFDCTLTESSLKNVPLIKAQTWIRMYFLVFLT